MKKFKLSMVALLAIVIGIGASAFTNRPAPKVSGVEWYIYNGNGDMDQPSSYHFDDGSEPACPTAEQELCAILVDGNGEIPNEEALQTLYQNNNEFAAPVKNFVKFRSSTAR